MTGEKLSAEEKSPMWIESSTSLVSASKVRCPKTIFKNICYNKMISSPEAKGKGCPPSLCLHSVILGLSKEDSLS